MARILFYEKPGCANNARQKKMLLEAGHELIVRNLLDTRWQEAELRAFFGQLPVTDWFNPAAPRVKSGEIVPESVTETAALALMLEDPLLIRRPLLQVGEHRQAGFDPAHIQEWIGLTADTDTGQDMESCQRTQRGP
jgi:nitrogenase-associated protein